jgi:hypothetical protein
VEVVDTVVGSVERIRDLWDVGRLHFFAVDAKNGNGGSGEKLG